MIGGDGEAEELLLGATVKALLENAATDPMAYVVPGAESGPRQCHTLFQTRTPDTPMGPNPPTVALPENAEATDLHGNSLYSVITASTMQQSLYPSGPNVREYRQLALYPDVPDEVRIKFQGTLKQYRQWEAEYTAKQRAVMAPPEPKKKAKDGKKDKAKDDKKKGKKGKKAVVEVVEVVEEKPPEPAFVQDFKISAFDHSVQLLKLRAQRRLPPHGEELLQRAKEALLSHDAEACDATLPAIKEAVSFSVRVENVEYERLAANPALLAEVQHAVRAAVAEEVYELGVVPEHVRIAFSSGSLIVDAEVDTPAGTDPETLRHRLGDSASLGRAVAAAVSSVYGIDEATIGEIYAAGDENAHQASEHDRTNMANTLEEALEEDGSKQRKPKDTNSRKAARDRLLAKQPFRFQWTYFESEEGIQFLMDTGAMDLDRRPIQKPKKEKRVPSQLPPIPPQANRNPWNPRLVGEPDPEEEEQRLAEADQDIEDDDQAGLGGTFRRIGMQQEDADHQIYTQGTAADGGSGYPSPSRAPIAAERHDDPVGPHPDKKQSTWDVYGNPRNPGKQMGHAHVAINQDYLEVEGATDRRVRTSSVSHKKNVAKAPSVSQVRKMGQHTVGRDSAMTARDILGDHGVTVPDEHWKVGSTMQGLGDINNLVEVVPGQCRFGPLRVGSVYRMAFYLRNLDVDVTRFNVYVKSDFVSVKHQPGHLAPGMAAKIVVEILAKGPAKIEQLVEIKVKAHIIRVPVTARIFDAEEYDRLDAESLALHERRIGRHREKGGDASNKPPPVELVMDEAYCRKVLGDAYQPHLDSLY
jgi:hypothetical protein